MEEPAGVGWVSYLFIFPFSLWTDWNSELNPVMLDTNLLRWYLKYWLQNFVMAKEREINVKKLKSKKGNYIFEIQVLTFAADQTEF